MTLTPMWRIAEKPEYEVEQTPGLWVLWGKCCRNEDCPKCGGTNSKVLATCGIKEDGTPEDPDMVHRITGLKSWTPERIHFNG